VLHRAYALGELLFEDGYGVGFLFFAEGLDLEDEVIFNVRLLLDFEDFVVSGPVVVAGLLLPTPGVRSPPPRLPV
jgi:hypothetical protein